MLIQPVSRGAVRRLLAGAIVFALPALASAQQQGGRPRSGFLRDPDPVPRTIPYPGASVTFETRPSTHARVSRVPVGSGAAGAVVIYAVPVYGAGSPGYGYGYGYGERGVGGATDVNGRPLSIGFDAGPAAGAVPSYTPDFSGSPYVVIEHGQMLVDLPSGERRAFHACAEATVGRDPAGRPRTVFYSGAEDGVILREGQRGRVQGTPPSGVTACYTVDSLGRLTLDY